MIQNFWSWLHSNSFYNPSKILGTPKWRKLGNPVKPKILARFQKNLVHFHISPGAISRQGIAKIADIGLIFTLITQRTAQTPPRHLPRVPGVVHDSSRSGSRVRVEGERHHRRRHRPDPAARQEENRRNQPKDGKVGGKQSQKLHHGHRVLLLQIRGRRFQVCT